MKTVDADIVKEISNYVNSYRSDYKEFARLMSYEHRTLQQQFTKLCIAWLKELSETENYDLRNEASIKFAQSIKDKLDKANLPLI
jgi:cell division inhibitor SulA